jgi:hypothetical protein
MRGRRIAWAAGLASAMLCPYRAAADAQQPVHWLTVNVSAIPQGVDAVRKACPGIDPALLSPGTSRVLPAGWDKKTSVAACTDLGALLRRYARQPPSTLPTASDLRQIALRLEQPSPPATASAFWNHVKAWLRRHSAPLRTLLKWFRLLPDGSAGPAFQTALLVGAGALILIAIAAVIFTELRAAGVLNPGRRRRHTRTRVAVAHESADADVAAADQLDSPASALRMLIAALRRSRRIDHDGSLTCREVLARALFDTPGQRDEFAGIALLAERQLFGSRGLPMSVPQELRPALRTLYIQLSAAPAARAPTA